MGKRGPQPTTPHEPPPRQRAKSRSRRALVISMLAGGLPHAQIARTLGISLRTVSRYASRADVVESLDAIGRESEASVARVLATLRETAARTLAQVMDDDEAAPAARVAAATALLDRTGHGPTSKLDLDASVRVAAVPQSKAEAIARAEALIAKLRGDPG